MLSWKYQVPRYLAEISAHTKYRVPPAAPDVARKEAYDYVSRKEGRGKPAVADFQRFGPQTTTGKDSEGRKGTKGDVRIEKRVCLSSTTYLPIYPIYGYTKSCHLFIYIYIPSQSIYTQSASSDTNDCINSQLQHSSPFCTRVTFARRSFDLRWS